MKLVDESCRETRVDDFTAALDHQPVDAPLCQRVDSRHEVDVVPVALALTFGPASALDHDDLGTGGRKRLASLGGRRRGDEQVGRRRVVEDPGVGRRPSGRVDDDAGGVARAAVPEPFDASVLLVEREVRVVREDGSNPD